MTQNNPVSAVSQLLSAHGIRSNFEKWALTAFIVIVVIYCASIVAGVLWKPAPAHTIDWGAAIVSRAVQAKDALEGLLQTLLGGVGISMARGHMDARIAPKDGDS